MNYLILVACTLAVATGDHSPYYPTPQVYYPQHIPVIDHNGVPVETPEVRAAKAEHLAAHAAVTGGTYTPHTPRYYPQAAIAHDGTPLDTPEVQAAKAHHFAAYNQAAARNGAYGTGGLIHNYQGPVDTPEVQLAKAQHFAAHANPHYRQRRGINYPYNYYQVPLIGANGVPLDTPEVQAAKAHHFAAHAEALGRASYAPQVSHYYPYVPTIGPYGVPLDTPEVQAAKVQHFAAIEGAKLKTYGYPAYYGTPYGYPNGAPADTPEVQHAKAAHFAAHAAARGHY